MAVDFQEIYNELQGLDPKNIGSASPAVRGILIAFLVIAILIAGYYFDTRHQITRLQAEERKELDLKKKFEQKQQKAVNLEAYKAQLEEMQYAFGSMLKQLPSKTEIPSLLVDISETGLSSGLKIDLFEPKDEQKKGFYAEKPINLDVMGTYEELAEFTSGVAALPRIVTLHDIALKPNKEGDSINMKAVAKTYRYLEE